MDLDQRRHPDPTAQTQHSIQVETNLPFGGLHMKIEQTRSQIVRLPVDEPLADGRPVPGTTRDMVVLRVATSDAIEGIGVTFFGGALTSALKGAVDALGELIIGEDANRVEHIAEKLRTAAASAGPGGIFTLALAAIDTALWDIRGKVAGLPLATVLGGFRHRVPAYASGALMRTLSLDEVSVAAQRLVERGWTAMKTQLALPGGTYPEPEVERIRKLREIIGPTRRLMCDINQRWSVPEAISIGERLEPYHLDWLEDVTVCEDYPGIARVAEKLATPIAGGEYVWGLPPFRHMLEARSVDIVMIDLLRVGGITPWMKVAGMAEAFNRPVVSHLIPEIHMHLMAAIPNGHIVEYMPWTARLFDDPPMPDRGEMRIKDIPGLGLAFTRAINEGFKSAT
jgi:L-alanine-DL-glutamate epimerase-like enolase superfamily enzyme